jgi:hypothetical protein
MTKLLTVRVIVPCDDGVLLDQLKAALTGHLESLPVDRVGDDGGRIHWSAADVLRGLESTAAPALRQRKKRQSNHHQGTLDE